ncbi:MAG: carbohydrate ABC transporter substrate-binding protein [Lachnospiraceae bacterium]|jgi:multiple sugar transport system substrate-binding protein|nr:carbohydrate ABC transporter substrate-binding protein [Lachnospiraceae bacterium]
MNNWKRITALVMSGMLVLGMSGCKGKAPESDDIEIEAVEEPAAEEPEEDAEVVSDLEASINWWTYPIFVQDEGQEDGVYEQSLIQKFNKKYPNIQVNLRMLDYTEGPGEIQGLIEGEGLELPDVLLDEPGRIGSYAKAGVLANLDGMFTDEVTSDMASQGILSACRSGGAYVMYPMSGSNYVMAFNRSMIEASGAIELMNREGACTWTTEAFEQVLERLGESEMNGGILYCSGIAGDYASRSFLTNLYDGTLMNEDGTAYIMNSEANQQALTKVKEWMEKGWLLNGSGSSGADAVTSFVSGENSFCLLWSLPQALSNAETLAGNGVEVVVMPYPSADGIPSLEYMLNGFCIFKTEDESREEAARCLVDFLCNDESVAAENVVRSGAFPVRTSMGDVYGGNEDALLYEALLPYSGTYYNHVEGFEEMRVYWYQMLAEILNGEYSVKDSTESFVEYANKTLEPKEEEE